MIALPGIATQDKIYESANSLVYRGIIDDGSAIVIKMLKQDYPSPQELTRYRQEYQIARSLDLEGVVKAYSQRRTIEGQYIRRIHDLPLIRDRSPSFALSWLALHPFAKRLQEENRYI